MKHFDWVPVLAIVGILGMAGLIGYEIVQEATEPDSGVVTARTYHPPWMSPGHYSQSCYPVDKGMNCTTTYIPPVYYPECYEVVYYNREADKTGDACVAPEDYEHRYETGAQYP